MQSKETENKQPPALETQVSEAEVTSQPATQRVDVPPEVRDNKFSLKDLRHPQSPYTPDQKIAAVAAYNAYGNSVKAEKACGIDAAVIRWWKANASWWPVVMEKVQQEMDDELIAGMQQVVKTCVANVQDAVENGEVRLNKKGEEVIVKPSARDQAWVAAVFTDKINVKQGKPTSISRRDTTEMLAELGKRLEETSREIRSIRDANDMKVVSEQ